MNTSFYYKKGEVMRNICIHFIFPNHFCHVELGICDKIKIIEEMLCLDSTKIGYHKSLKTLRQNNML